MHEFFFLETDCQLYALSTLLLRKSSIP
jgi:hypothetical protein